MNGVESRCKCRTTEEVSVFSTKNGRGDKDDTAAVKAPPLSETDREALAWLEDYLSAPQTEEDRRWGREFRRFLSGHRLDLRRGDERRLGAMP